MTWVMERILASLIRTMKLANINPKKIGITLKKKINDKEFLTAAISSGD